MVALGVGLSAAGVGTVGVGVMLRGRWLSREELAERLDAMATAYGN